MAQRDEEEFHDFVVARWDSLLRTAFLLTGDRGHAEDLVQQTLVIVHRKWTHIHRADAPVAYARAVLVNQAKSRWRRRRVTELLTDDPPPAPTPDAYADYDRKDELWRALQHLPPRMRAAVVLRYFNDLTEADAARTLGCSIGSVKSQTSRGLSRLRDVLDAGRIQDGSQP